MPTTQAPESLLTKRPILIGVVHLAPLPGAPGWSPEDGLSPLLRRAVKDARVLARAGFDGVLIENFGDAPFFKDAVPPETVAALSVVACAVRDALPAEVEVGVNVLRNDALSGLAIAAAAGLGFLRVNVLSGAILTDQGIVEGRAAEVARMRARLTPNAQILADVQVKHAVPLAERPLDEEVQDLVERGGADAVIVTGPRTGAEVGREILERVRRAASDTTVLVGSGANAQNIGRLLVLANGVIVGTALKRGGHTTAPIDPRRAARFVAAAR